MSDMDEIEQSIMTALRKAYQLGLDEARRTEAAWLLKFADYHVMAPGTREALFRHIAELEARHVP